MMMDWLTRPFRAALDEIKQMHHEREWANLDDKVSEVEAKIGALNAYQADRYENARLHWQRGGLVWQGEPPAELGRVGQARPAPTRDHERGIDR